MKAGKLTKRIHIQRLTTEPNEFGTPVEDWRDHKQLRAELVQRSSEEFLNAQGAVDKDLAVFRVRYVEDITNADRIQFRSEPYLIKSIAEIGRRRWLEIRCERLD